LLAPVLILLIVPVLISFLPVREPSLEEEIGDEEEEAAAEASERD